VEIYERIRVMRVLKGLSQEKLAEELGYSLNAYARIERGESDISVRKLERILEKLGTNLQQLLGLNEGNVLNFAENCNPINLTQGSIFLTETRCVHELEKANLLLRERDKEISYLNQEVENLKQIITLLQNKT
jgi:transcriptional regulator with XRE-family HTH domain